MTKKKKGKVKFLLVVQNKFIISAMGLGQCLKYGEYKTKTKTKINKGKDQRQKKKKTNHIICKNVTHHKFKKITMIHLRLLLTHNAKLNKFIN